MASADAREKGLGGQSGPERGIKAAMDGQNGEKRLSFQRVPVDGAEGL
jgi:hypothetical protein